MGYIMEDKNELVELKKEQLWLRSTISSVKNEIDSLQKKLKKKKKNDEDYDDLAMVILRKKQSLKVLQNRLVSVNEGLGGMPPEQVEELKKEKRTLKTLIADAKKKLDDLTKMLNNLNEDDPKYSEINFQIKESNFYLNLFNDRYNTIEEKLNTASNGSQPESGQ